MLNVVAETSPGKAATVTLLRNGSPISLKLMVGKRPPPRERDLEE
jgi:hypothetical protein